MSFSIVQPLHTGIPQKPSKLFLLLFRLDQVGRQCLSQAFHILLCVFQAEKGNSLLVHVVKTGNYL